MSTRRICMKKNASNYIKLKRLVIIIILVLSSLFFLCHNEVKANSDEQTIIFYDKNLYNSIVLQLNEKIKSQIANDANKTYSIIINTEDIKDITELKLDNCDIRNISGLENFINLNTLNLSNNKLKDGEDSIEAVTEQLKTLTSLKELNLSHNYLKYTSGLEHLANLKKLNLYDNAISDLSGLNNLQNLTYLNLGENNENEKKLHTMAPLENINTLTGLIFLDFSDNNTPDIINHLYNLTNLEKLFLQSNKITIITKTTEDINPRLENLKKLQTLNLYNNNLVDRSLYSLTLLTNLKELNLGKTDIRRIDKFVNNQDEIIWPNLEKIDISDNKYLYTLYLGEQSNNNITRVANNQYTIDKLKEKTYINNQGKNQNIEINYEYLSNVANLPHYDEEGIAYVTYEDFGARRDGEYDDFIAIRNAHIFANENGYEVRATEGNPYHIFKYYEDAVSINTNVNWENATFIIHDEKIDNFFGRHKNLFKVSNLKDVITLNQSDINNISGFEIKKNTKQIPISNYLTNLNENGYKKYLCIAENSNKKQFIRYGTNSNNGESQQDYFTIDSQGNVLNDIQWDFDEITSFKIYAIPNSELKIQNGKFISNKLNSENEATYTRSGSGKDIYFHRNIYIEKAANVSISNIKHLLSEDDISGSYRGFIYANIGYNINISNCKLYARKYTTSGRSTYDLNLKAIVNCNCENITSNNDNDEILDNNRWGIVATYYCKDVIFKNCTLNRIDAHEGIYNLTIDNCNIGIHGLTMVGQGTLNVINTKITAEAFISLRTDYGSTWNGNVNIIDCLYKYKGTYMPKLFYYKLNVNEEGTIHDYGYKCKFPDVNVNNLKINLEDVPKNNNGEPKYKSVYIIPNINDINNKESSSNIADEDYWPSKIIIKGYRFVNDNDEVLNINSDKTIEVVAKKENMPYTIIITDESDLENKLYYNCINLTGIRVEKEPKKTKYKEGEDFDTTGMKILATYIDGTTKEITNYVVINGKNLTLEQKNVTISYTEYGENKTTIQNIIVNETNEGNTSNITKENNKSDATNTTDDSNIVNETNTIDNSNTANVINTTDYTDTSNTINPTDTTNATDTNNSLLSKNSDIDQRSSVTIKSLPKTGKNYLIIFIIFILAILLFSISYKEYIKNKNIK